MCMHASTHTNQHTYQSLSNAEKTQYLSCHQAVHTADRNYTQESMTYLVRACVQRLFGIPENIIWDLISWELFRNITKTNDPWVNIPDFRVWWAREKEGGEGKKKTLGRNAEVCTQPLWTVNAFNTINCDVLFMILHKRYTCSRLTLASFQETQAHVQCTDQIRWLQWPSLWSVQTCGED